MAKQGDNKRNWTALHKAVHEDDVQKVRLLVSAGANVNARDRYGQIPMLRGEKIFMNFAENYLDQMEILQILVNAGSDLLSRDSKEVLQIADILSYGRRELVRIVMQSNVDFSINDGCLMTPLYCLAGNTCDGIVDEIRHKKFNFQSPCKEESAIKEAMCARNPKMFEFLLENGQQNHALDSSFLTTACIFPLPVYTEIIELALEYKVDPLQEMEVVLTALMMETVGMFGSHPLDCLKQVVAHLALQEIVGIPNAKTMSFIHAIPPLNLKNYYAYCKIYLNAMKVKVICESMTYFQLLIADKENIKLYARDEELVARLRRVNDFENGNEFYDRLIRKRLAMIFNEATL